MSILSAGLSLAAQMMDRANFPILPVSPGSFFVSEVLDSTAWYGTVVVSPPMGGPIQGVPLQDGSGTWGPRRLGAAYPPHTKVMCYRPVGAPYCLVIGAMPDWIGSATFNKVPSWIVMASQSGFGFDAIHNQRFNVPAGDSGDINFSAGAPADDLPGDYGHLNEFGIGYGIGRLMAWMRASHFCAVETHFADNLLRLVGYNFEQLLGAGERRAFDDEGEWNDVERWGPYPWETRGVVDKDADFTEKGDGEWNQSADGDSHPRAGREPIEDDQTGLWRVQKFRGYLGDLERTIVARPDASSLTTDVERLSNRTIACGVVDAGFTADGRYRISSSRGVLLEKTAIIPVPKELAAPDDPEGDTADNYRASGAYGNGDSHDKPEIELDDDQPGLRAAIRLDRHALLHSLYDNIAFHRHANDWYLPEEQDVLAAVGLPHGLYQADGELSAEAFWMPLPRSELKSVDHRGSQKFFVGRAAIEIDDDGSVNIEDAYGSQVRLEGGNAFVSARHDVVLQPGRNFTVLAPNDIILRAGNSVDISGSKGDVRVKAEGNMLLSAQTKGILLEANDEGGTPDWKQMGESVESRGVLIKATKSSFVAMSRDTYIRAGIRDEHQATGELHLDAGGGRGDAYIHGDTITGRALSKAEFIVGSTGENESTASLDLRPSAFILGGKSMQSVVLGGTNFSFGHEDYDAAFNFQGNLFLSKSLWVESQAVIGGAVWCGSDLVVQKDYRSNGNIVVTKSILCNSVAADRSNGFLPSTGDNFNASEQVPPSHPDTAKDQLEGDAERARNALRSARREDNDTVSALQSSLYGDNSKFASAELADDAVFAFRTSDDYGTSADFRLYESRWQQYNRLLFGATATWEEDAIEVPFNGRKTLPYPGHEVWEDQEALITIDLSLFDMSSGTARSRADLEAGEIGSQTAKKLSTGYVVTRQGGTQRAQE